MLLFSIVIAVRIVKRKEPEAITLPMIRSLQLGMPSHQVKAKLGPRIMTTEPEIIRTPGKALTRPGHETWFYGIPSGGTCVIGYYHDALCSVHVVDAEGKTVFTAQNEDWNR